MITIIPLRNKKRPQRQDYCSNCKTISPENGHGYFEIKLGDDLSKTRICLCESCAEELNLRVREIAAFPTADVRDNVHGEWIKISPTIYECNKCGKRVFRKDIYAYNFCHGCGADMREE